MLKIAFALYRQWGYDIYKNINEYQKLRNDFQITNLILSQNHQCKLPPSPKINTTILDPKDALTIKKVLQKTSPDLIFWYSWSFIIPNNIVNQYTSLCLHPSPLPRYRGGSPIQNQIINHETDSKISIFKITEGLDSGPIYKQAPISLLGNISFIFSRMIDIGTILTTQLITDAILNQLAFTPQKNLDQFPPLKRRRPEQSEIKLNQISKTKFEDLNNLIRSLLDPYPNAFINLGASKIYLHHIEKITKPQDANILNTTPNPIISKKNLFLKLSDCYVKITNYQIKKIS